MKTSAGILAERILQLFLTAACCCLFASCDDATPRNYFDRAILNCNLIHGFASKGLQRELDSPSVKLMNAKTGASAPMKRKEVIDDKIASIEQSLEKVRKLRQTDDTKEIVQASIALHEYVLPVYRNEYLQLAKLYDDGAPKAQIETLASAIAAKYRPRFEVLFDSLTAAGKPYAARHDIKFVWDIQTSPSLQPSGRTTIAQRFSAGDGRGKMERVPSRDDRSAPMQNAICTARFCRPLRDFVFCAAPFSQR